MCDTVTVIGDDGVLFAKNSDRDPNEAQVLEWVPAGVHDPHDELICTWISIAQAPSTNAVVLSRPWWMWGAEMGMNEHGLVIGNEAVFTRQPLGDPALLGMDLVRLGLERASSTEDAAGVIVELLERHGQGGSCSLERPGFSYHNSFLIADPRSAMVLETAGRRWATEEVTHGVRSISNGLTIPAFAKANAKRLRARVAACEVRRALTEASSASASSPGDLFRVMRDHGGSSAPTWSRIHGGLEAPCVHAGGVLASSQTTASFVADLRADPIAWATATAAPCTSLFKPISVAEPVDLGPAPTNHYEDESLWWRHERLHRATLRRFGALAPLYRSKRDEVESQWLQSPPPSADAFAMARDHEEEWLHGLPIDLDDNRPSWVKKTWAKADRQAGFPG